MVDFVRLFQGDRPVEGLRPTGRVTSRREPAEYPPAPPSDVTTVDVPAPAVLDFPPGLQAETDTVDLAAPELVDFPPGSQADADTVDLAAPELVDFPPPAHADDEDAVQVTGRDVAPAAELLPGDEAEHDAGSAEGSEGTFALAMVKPAVPSPLLLSAHEPAHPHSEKIRLLRTEILLRHAARDQALAIAIVGASPGEGRSQLAAELALGFAQLGRSTLLLDADMRNPRQHELFGIELGDGLAQAIERREIPAQIAVEGYPTLFLVTAGITSSNPLELLSDGRFEILLDELRDGFEFIIVDTPHCASSADGLVIATMVGHVLTVQRAGTTSYKEARSMLRQLVSARADILGGVLNHF